MGILARLLTTAPYPLPTRRCPSSRTALWLRPVASSHRHRSSEQREVDGPADRRRER
uniref:Uncharacterized protein n=1 Tax=Arundo donax TaxID=35708 RepID=A0A0A9GEN2_ARUDO